VFTIQTLKDTVLNVKSILSILNMDLEEIIIGNVVVLVGKRIIAR
jgi:hypothetical protein